MKNCEKILKIAISTVLSIATTGALLTNTTAFAAQAQETEKCYGVVKAGMNDCNTATASCAGSATKDAQPDAFILVPKGLCNKLVNGSLKSKT